MPTLLQQCPRVLFNCIYHTSSAHFLIKARDVALTLCCYILQSIFRRLADKMPTLAHAVCTESGLLP